MDKSRSAGTNCCAIAGAKLLIPMVTYPVETAPPSYESLPSFVGNFPAAAFNQMDQGPPIVSSAAAYVINPAGASNVINQNPPGTSGANTQQQPPDENQPGRNNIANSPIFDRPIRIRYLKVQGVDYHTDSFPFPNFLEERSEKNMIPFGQLKSHLDAEKNHEKFRRKTPKRKHPGYKGRINLIPEEEVYARSLIVFIEDREYLHDGNSYICQYPYSENTCKVVWYYLNLLRLHIKQFQSADREDWIAEYVQRQINNLVKQTLEKKYKMPIGQIAEAYNKNALNAPENTS